jgi:hypothetical protein
MTEPVVTRIVVRTAGLTITGPAATTIIVVTVRKTIIVPGFIAPVPIGGTGIIVGTGLDAGPDL